MSILTTPALFNDIHCRAETMLAYETNYFPSWHMKPQHKIVYSKQQFMSKKVILNCCNESLTHLYKREEDYLIHWAYGNIPTKKEWDELYEQTVMIVEFRISPLIEDGEGRIALITPHGKDYYEGEL